MNYLQATIELKNSISDINKSVIDNKIITQLQPNHLFLNLRQETKQIKMDSFTDEFIAKQKNTYASCNSLVFTNLASMNVNNEELTYFLYKGYHYLKEEGMVYYQPVNKETLEPIGELKFSNQESNIFYQLQPPNFEESSCNAIEAKGSTKVNRKIVLLIGNTNEERLLFDIERLILTTLNNTRKHPSLKFHFILSIDKFNGTFGDSFAPLLSKIKEATQAIIEDYPNVFVEFEYADKD